jgi:hypothetical protein
MTFFRALTPKLRAAGGGLDAPAFAPIAYLLDFSPNIP